MYKYKSQCCLQGDFVVLACEPVCLVGVDVSASQQIRRGAIEPISKLFETFERQCSPTEVFAPSQVLCTAPKETHVQLCIAKHILSLFSERYATVAAHTKCGR